MGAVELVVEAARVLLLLVPGIVVFGLTMLDVWTSGMASINCAINFSDGFFDFSFLTLIIFSYFFFTFYSR
jgi:hypothetical protein